MRTFLKTVEVAVGMIVLVLLAGSREADAAPIRADTCIDLDAGSLATAGCVEDQDGTAAGVVSDANGQVTTCGNAIAVFGEGSASCDGTQSASGSTGGGSGSGDADVSGSGAAQATACGNSVAVAGDAQATCDGQQQEATQPDDGIDVMRWGLAVQGMACGNSVGVFGDAEGSCDGSQDSQRSDGAGDGTDVRGAGTAQALACGNSLAVGGSAGATCSGRVQPSEGGEEDDDGNLALPPADPPLTDVLGEGGVAGAPGVAALTGATIGSVALAALVLLILGVITIWATARVPVRRRSDPYQAESRTPRSRPVALGRR